MSCCHRSHIPFIYESSVGRQPQVVAASSSHRAPPNILPPGRKPHAQAVGEWPLHQVAARWRPLLRRTLTRDNRPNGADLARAAGAIPSPVSIGINKIGRRGRPSVTSGQPALPDRPWHTHAAATTPGGVAPRPLSQRSGLARHGSCAWAI